MSLMADPLITDPVSTGEDIQDDTKDEITEHAIEFANDSFSQNSDRRERWNNAKSMYEQCLDGSSDNVNLYTPSYLIDIIDRLRENYQLTDYQLRIPGSTPVQRQLVRDTIAQIEESSGLTSAIRDDPGGSLSLFLYGMMYLWWGVTSKKERKNGVPLEFNTVDLFQVYLPPLASSIRTPNGKRIVDECMIIFQMPWNEVVEDYPDAANAAPGVLPTTFSNEQLQHQQIDSQTDFFAQMTQVGHYYHAEKGIYQVIVGENSTIVEKADDNDKSLPNYPFKLDGENILPISPHGAFAIPGEKDKRGCYDRFGKLARNEARVNNMGHRYAQRNIATDRIIKMDDEDGFETLQDDLAIAQQIKAEGGDPIVRVPQDAEIVFDDTRTQPLTTEFERIRKVIRQKLTEGGVSIGDVDRPASETATVATFDERNKNRLTSQIVISNTGEAKFVRRVILDAVEKWIPKSSVTPVATNAKISAEDNLVPLPEGVEAPVKNVTLGQMSQYVEENTIYVQSDFSAYEDIGFKLAKLRTALGFAGNTPQGAKILSDLLGTLGMDVSTQKLAPLPPQGGETGGIVPETNRPITNQTQNQALAIPTGA